mgnify:CR=1 FL=1
MTIEWDHTCEIVAVVMNTTARKQVTTARQLNPFRKKPLQPLYLDDIDHLLLPET